MFNFMEKLVILPAKGLQNYFGMLSQHLKEGYDI